jgi:hypothetical protein
MVAHLTLLFFSSVSKFSLSPSATDVLHEFFADMPTGAIDFGALLEATIPTPTIALNETDANYWFSNPQVRSDVRDSFASRDGTRYFPLWMVVELQA